MNSCGVEWQIGVERRRDRDRRGGEQQRLAVRRGLRHLLRAEAAAGAAAVFQDEGALGLRRQPLVHQPRRHIDRTAGRKRHDHAHGGGRRPVLRRRSGGKRGERCGKDQHAKLAQSQALHRGSRRLAGRGPACGYYRPREKRKGLGQMKAMLKPRHRVAAGALLLAAVLGLSPSASAAESYPTRSVTILTPFAAGSVTDAAARVLAQALQEQLGQTFVVENRPGAGGILSASPRSRARRTTATRSCSPPTRRTPPQTACSRTCPTIRSRISRRWRGSAASPRSSR